MSSKALQISTPPSSLVVHLGKAIACFIYVHASAHTINPIRMTQTVDFWIYIRNGILGRATLPRARVAFALCKPMAQALSEVALTRPGQYGFCGTARSFAHLAGNETGTTSKGKRKEKRKEKRGQLSVEEV